MTYLTTFDENYEIDMLREMLENNGIDLLAKHRETGDYLMITAGMSMFGADLYVEDQDFERAKEILDAYFEAKDPLSEEELEMLALEATPETTSEDE